jgi:hypothetical protein
MRRVPSIYDFQARCAALVLSTVFTATTFAAADPSPYEAKVISPSAPVRSGPGDDFYPTDTLAQGAVVEVYRVRPDGWLGIRPPVDSFSWLFGKHVKLLDNGLAEVQKEDVASRIGSRINDKRNAAQVRLKRGEVVEIIGEQTQGGQIWYKIAPPAGEFRWIHSRNVDRTDGEVQGEPPPPPAVVTVPMADENAIPAAAPITLVAADSPPATQDTWRAAPPGSAAIVAAPGSPDGSQIVRESGPVVRGSGPVVRGSPDPAPPTDAASSSTPPAVASPQPSAGPDVNMSPAGTQAEGLSRQLTDLEMRLSRIVIEPPATWQIEPLEREAEQLLSQTNSVHDRKAVETTLAKIGRFASIGRRYRQFGPNTSYSGSGDLRTTFGDPGTTVADPRTMVGDPRSSVADPRTGVAMGVVGPDGQRYDAVGILRPVVSKRAGAPQFALVNEHGQVVSFITPTPDVNLQPYVGHQIGVTGTRGYIPEFQRAHVTAGRVAPLADRFLR